MYLLVSSGAQRYPIAGLTEKRVLDEMEAKNEKLALLGMLGYDLTWHRYIYKTRLKRAIEKMEEANLQDTETYKTAQVNLRFLEQ